MQVEAIYDQGRLSFAQPLQLKHNYLRLVVEVPDDEIVMPSSTFNLGPEALASARLMLNKFEAIRNAPLPHSKELPALTPKQMERIDAFELRAQMREEQGRPA